MYFSKIPSLYNILTFFKKSLTQEQFLNFWNSPNSYSRLISKSSWSLELISRFKNKKPCNIYVPSYFCNYALKQVRKNNILSFYPVKNDFTLDLEFLKKNSKNIDILILVNYFGKTFINNEIYQFCKINKIWLVEDNTHIFLPTKKEFNGDFQLYSPYKFLPIPLGAILTLNNRGPNDLNLNLLKDQNNWEKILKELYLDFRYMIKDNFLYSFVWTLKKIIQNVIPIQKQYPDFNNEKIEKKVNNILLDFFSKKIIFSLNKINFFKDEIRSVSIKIWDNFIDQENINNNFYDNVEFNRYIIKSNEYEIIKIYNDFLKKNIPVTTWPDLPEEIFVNKNLYNKTIQLRNSLIFLPTYSTDNLKYLSQKSCFNYSIELKKKIRFDYNSISKKEWNNFISRCCNNNLLQSWEHGEAKIKNNKLIKVSRFMIYYENKLVAACQMFIFSFFRLFYIYYINRGPVYLNGLDDKVKKEIVERISLIADIKRLKILLFKPEISNNFKYLVFKSKTNFVFNSLGSWSSYKIDLNQGIDHLLKKMNRTWRKLINHFNKSDFEFIYDDTNTKENFNWIINNYVVYKKIKKFNGLPLDYLESLYAQGALLSLVVRKNGNIQAGNIFFIQNNIATNLIEFLNSYAKIKDLNYFLLYKGIQKLINMKISTLDLGGIDSINLKNITNFKKGLGGEMYSLIGKSFFKFT